MEDNLGSHYSKDGQAEHDSRVIDHHAIEAEDLLDRMVQKLSLQVAVTHLKISVKGAKAFWILHTYGLQEDCKKIKGVCLGG